MFNRYSGFINKLLSWSGFVPLSRLTYAAYLVHPMVIEWFYNSRKSLLFIDHSTMVSFNRLFFYQSTMVSLNHLFIDQSTMVSLNRLFIDQSTMVSFNRLFN